MNIEPRAIGGLALIALLASVACSDDENDMGSGNADMGTGRVDLGSPDLGPPRTTCPSAGLNPECSDQTDCEELKESQTCVGCPGFNEDFFCAYDPNRHASCQRFTSSDQQGVVVNVPITLGGGLSSNDIEFFVGVAVAAETSGGGALTCEDFFADPLNFDPNDTCQNVALSVRVSKDAARQGNSFLTQFTRIPPDRDYLFLVYAFESDDFSRDPVGVYCTMPEEGAIPDNDVAGAYPFDIGPIIGGQQDMLRP